MVVPPPGQTGAWTGHPVSCSTGEATQRCAYSHGLSHGSASPAGGPRPCQGDARLQGSRREVSGLGTWGPRSPALGKGRMRASYISHGLPMGAWCPPCCSGTECKASCRARRGRRQLAPTVVHSIIAADPRYSLLRWTCGRVPFLRTTRSVERGVHNSRVCCVPSRLVPPLRGASRPPCRYSPALGWGRCLLTWDGVGRPPVARVPYSLRVWPPAGGAASPASREVRDCPSSS